MSYKRRNNIQIKLPRHSGLSGREAPESHSKSYSYKISVLGLSRVEVLVMSFVESFAEMTRKEPLVSII